jgi:MHS family proline/betaine transporter-like MFS transporter
LKTILAGIFGNIFEHYDKHLFTFLAPFLAPLFFPDFHPLTALLFTYGMLPLGIISKPLGALFFGKIGDWKGRNVALSLTLIGMAITTLLMGCLPSFHQIGSPAPFLLALFYMAQNFFAAGEITGSALLILDNCSPKKRSFFSSIYDASSLIGILLAALLVALLSYYNGVEKYWRLLYFGGAITLLIGIAMRHFPKEKTPLHDREPQLSLFPLLWKYRRLVVALILVAGFSHTTFESITSLLNGFLPLISPLTKAHASHFTTILLLIDLLILPLSGYLAMRFSKEKVMLSCALAATLLAFPLFHLLPKANPFSASIICTTFVMIGAGFSAPLYAWAQEITPQKYRFTLISFSTTIGSQLIGKGTCFCTLYLYKQTGWSFSPALYIAAVALLTSLSIVQNLRKPLEAL